MSDSNHSRPLIDELFERFSVLVPPAAANGVPGGDGAVIDRPEETAWAARRAPPLIVPEISDSRALAPPHPARSILPRCPELDCVRHLLAPAVFAMAELRAAEVGVGADRVLIAQGPIDEETYLKALARQRASRRQAARSLPAGRRAPA